MPLLHPTFTVTYCRNCDGGMQEMNTMIQCLRSVFPLASVETIRKDDNFPVEATIVASTSLVREIPIWSGKQQHLFEKYRVRRRKTMKIIIKTLNQFKENLETSQGALKDRRVSTDLEPVSAVKIPSPTLVAAIDGSP